MQLVPKQVATQKLADIGKEQAILSSLLLEWECPRPSTVLVGYIPPIAQIVPGSKHSHSLPPVFLSFDINWKIQTTPKTKGRDTLDVPLWEVTSHNNNPQAPLAGVLAKARGPAWVGPLSPHIGLSIVKPTLQPGQNQNVGAYPSL
jgi:hypothetical protein